MRLSGKMLRRLLAVSVITVVAGLSLNVAPASAEPANVKAGEFCSTELAYHNNIDGQHFQCQTVFDKDTAKPRMRWMLLCMPSAAPSITLPSMLPSHVPSVAPSIAPLRIETRPVPTPCVNPITPLPSSTTHTASSPASASPVAQATSLPLTGSRAEATVGIGLLLLVIGGVALYVSRRRRVRFEN
jgi:LPXTG-motif cell wall-anchored protein